ncbi:MAG: hypothetical protein M0Z61_03770 [Nitrospiraceae bacterium]|nr:hypothetical protein [Nitrospiraceae bacterium]
MKKNGPGRHKLGEISLFSLLLLLLSLSSASAAMDPQNFNFAPDPAPETYGNIIMKPVGAKSVIFSHWVHRLRYTCRVCHFELQINFKTGSTGITMESIVKGKYCGACHNGKEAFGIQKCSLCHNGGAGPDALEFSKKAGGLPPSNHGNRIDWGEAIEENLIKPVSYLKVKPEEFPFNQLLTLQAAWDFVPSAVFPHEAHNRWLDCNNCHPDIFDIKNVTEDQNRMSSYFKGQFCGVCHGKVAFPLKDCHRCHRGMPNWR